MGCAAFDLQPSSAAPNATRGTPKPAPSERRPARMRDRAVVGHRLRTTAPLQPMQQPTTSRTSRSGSSCPWTSCSETRSSRNRGATKRIREAIRACIRRCPNSRRNRAGTGRTARPNSRALQQIAAENSPTLRQAAFDVQQRAATDPGRRLPESDHFPASAAVQRAAPPAFGACRHRPDDQDVRQAYPGDGLLLRRPWTMRVSRLKRDAQRSLDPGAQQLLRLLVSKETSASTRRWPNSPTKCTVSRESCWRSPGAPYERRPFARPGLSARLAYKAADYILQTGNSW